MTDTTRRKSAEKKSGIGCRGRARSFRQMAAVLLGPLLGAVLWSGCSLDGLLKSDELPPDVTDPAITKTPAGARAAYRGTLALFRNAFAGRQVSAVPVIGLLTDELYDNSETAGTISTGVDLRILSESNSSTSETYSRLQKVRGQASQAIRLLGAYVPEQPALAGELFALSGYSEVLLADLFCSGIPLSTLDYNGDYTYQPGSTTDAVYAHAQALFDSALALGADSMSVVHLARVGQARALLARGQYAAAAAAAAPVPDDFRYNVSYTGITDVDAVIDATNFAGTDDLTPTGKWLFGIADHEGRTGLDYVSSQDPRTPVVPGGSGELAYNFPAWLGPDGSGSIVLASGIEARLIEAEAALQAGDVPGWLAKLNALRTDGTSATDTIADTLGVSGCKPYPDYCGGPNGPAGDTPDRGQPVGGFRVPAGYTLADSVILTNLPQEIRSTCSLYSWYQPCYNDGTTTVYYYIGQLWHAGTGGYDGLALLADPGATLAGAAADSARVDLLFRERAFWLFLTAHRQGDLRRLIRQYHRDQSAVYPTGQYRTGVYKYGTDVTARIPTAERVSNPRFTGCGSTGA